MWFRYQRQNERIGINPSGDIAMRFSILTTDFNFLFNANKPLNILYNT